MHPLAQLDHQFVWHPFTQMQDWLAEEPIVIVHGKGVELQDASGKVYLDANASIWTNLHGHQHPVLDRAIRRQLKRVAHVSALGLANEPASLLASELVRCVNPEIPEPIHGNPRLDKVFYSDDGSTALEVALKLAYEFTRRTHGPTVEPRFLSMDGAYHGDTIGAVSLGHIDLFHAAYKGLLFPTDKVMAPACYRCPYNRAQPQRADARSYRRCQWECVDTVDQTLEQARQQGRPYSAFLYEPAVQGAAGIVPQPSGWLRRVAERVRAHGALLIADEVFTGFGRTHPFDQWNSLFASHTEGVQPDLMALAKGLTGGYMPLAATLCRSSIFDAFLGTYDSFKTFFHGHSYTGNPLGCAVASASLSLLEAPGAEKRRGHIAKALATELATLWDCPWVGDIRQIGLIAGVELVRDWTQRTPFALSERVGIRVCQAMAKRGVLTRPVGNVIVFVPPYVTKKRQIQTMVGALKDALDEVLG